MFWDIMPCSLLKVNRRFGGTYRFHLKGLKISQARNQLEAGSEQRRNVPPNRRLTSNGLHGVIFQKMEIFITTVLACDEIFVIFFINKY
jgi:hypothetical protein